MNKARVAEAVRGIIKFIRYTDVRICTKCFTNVTNVIINEIGAAIRKISVLLI
jgi:hypothetical protein